MANKESTFQKLASGNFEAEPPLSEVESEFLTVYLGMFDAGTSGVPSNKKLAKHLGVSRNEAGRIRRSVAQKIDIIRGGF